MGHIVDKNNNGSARLQIVFKVFGNILDSIREPLVFLDSYLQVVKANRAFYQTFDVKPEETEGEVIFNLGNRQWDIPKLRELLVKVLPQNMVFDDLEVEHTFETIGRKVMHLNARRIFHKTGQPELILLAIEDVTEREDQKKDLEELVTRRTAELIVAKEEAEKEKDAAERALGEIKMLKAQLEAETIYLREEIKLEYNHEKIVGHSDGLKYVLYKVEQIASSDTTVLVLGETGTGKELVARAIHDLSLRKSRPLIKVNCAALPANLIESELFGHEKGAFTGAQTKHLGRFEVADGATLFLDEIGELPIELQAKLLRVVQDGEFERLGGSHTKKVDVRIIAATNRDLEEEVRKGGFREDLWYRLNIFPITMPPLRERLDDIPLLVEYYVEKIAKRMGKNITHIPTSVMGELQSYRWPGNIRELENVLERAVINSSGSKLHLADQLRKPPKYLSTGTGTLEAVERNHILRVLEQTNWKVSGKNSAAEILGLDRSTLRARMIKLNIHKS
ncbi:sigma-54 interaction domain-containing protein [Desulfofustis glycolicus]|uniref:Chemotaxis protein methyltransferase CheR n=1 Tax=Desulfofustis glycolicus DSM 9705 TaxID=1121409 RepID=A0A1M5VXW8_9BACT|nr:sigma 54-interacting transcriptional regulator [Desulfofustis glycolicus]MCB2215192.1 sigma 54-interacting transcriptional regulator [Desulfobulbaceae bacterium]SHH80086.1 chemotaxis protein methyltransferase CheR [Desulfofustis glycolicus DSM 9705]